MIGEDLRQRRKALGLTQAQLGQALDRPQHTISRWERGDMAIESPGVLRFLLKCLEEDKSAFGPDHAGWIASLPTFLGRDPARR